MPIPDAIAACIDARAERASGVYTDLRVVVFNGTTKRSPEPRHTDGLLAISLRIFATLGEEAGGRRSARARVAERRGRVARSQATRPLAVQGS
jgi:hypothetical protein